MWALVLFTPDQRCLGSQTQSLFPLLSGHRGSVAAALRRREAALTLEMASGISHRLVKQVQTIGQLISGELVCLLHPHRVALQEPLGAEVLGSEALGLEIVRR